MVGEKRVGVVAKPQQEVMGGKGFMRFFVAKKNGAYEITYNYPRSPSEIKQIGLSSIIHAVGKQGKVNDEIYTKRGKIDDIKIFYETILEE